MEEDLAQFALECGVAVDRIQRRNDATWRGRGEYVLWWPVTSPALSANETLNIAKAAANSARLPLVAMYCFDLKHFQAGSIRHIRFLLEGLAQMDNKLKAQGIPLFIAFEPSSGDTAASTLIGSGSSQGLAEAAYAIFTDQVFSRRSREVLNTVSAAVDCPCISVDSTLLISIPRACPNAKLPKQEEFIQSWLEMSAKESDRYLDANVANRTDAALIIATVDNITAEKISTSAAGWLDSEKKLMSVLISSGVDCNVPIVSASYRGGESAARKLASIFVTRKLMKYWQGATTDSESRRGEYGSLLSPYLSCGFISVRSTSSMAIRARQSDINVRAFMEKLALRDYAYVRAALSTNFASYEYVNEETREYLERRRSFLQKERYSLTSWENADTHEASWNAIQRELLQRGRLRSNDRRIWCHKIIEYEPDPREAFRIAQTLNDKYMLDALSPVGDLAIAENGFVSLNDLLYEQLQCFESFPRFASTRA